VTRRSSRRLRRGWKCGQSTLTPASTSATARLATPGSAARWGWDDCALRLAAETRQQSHVEQAVAVPLLTTDAIADRDQAAHDNALHDSAEQRLELVGELEHVADTETVEARVVAASRAAL